jgi:ketosteroid isomerase-like protein
MTKKNVVLAAVQGAALALVFTGAAHAASYSAEKAQILSIEQAMSAAQTAPAVLKYFDPNVVFDDMTPGQVRGLKAVGADLTAQFAAVKDVKVQILNMSIDADTKLAFAYSTQTLSMVNAQSGQPESITFRQADAYHRVDGKWLLIYQNISVPFDPKTGKAVFNAAP